MTRKSVSTAAEFVKSPFAREVVDTQPLRVQSSLMLSQLLKDIGFHDVIQRWCSDQGDIPSSKILEAYIHCRFNSPDPVPVSRFQEWISHSCLPQLLGEPAEKFNEYRLGRVLELAGHAPQAMWIELIANAHRRFRLDLSYIINDTTSFYFEGEYEDSVLARYGYSRDGKPECKQVNVTISVTPTGIPLQYAVIPGNTADTSTVIPNVEALCTLFRALGDGGKRVVVVADKGLLTMRLIHYYTGAKVGYVGCMKCPKYEATIIREVTDHELRAGPLAYLATRYKGKVKKQESERYYAVRRKPRLEAFTEDGIHYPMIEVSAMVVYSEGKKRLDQQRREDCLEKTESRFGEISGHLNHGRYCSRAFAQCQIDKALKRYPSTREMLVCSLSEGSDGLLSMEWKRDQDVIEKAAFLDGKYVVYTSEEHLSNDDLFATFKSRDKVEKRIETLKGPVVVRPIYLHKDARIRGLIFTAMTAILLFGLMELLALRDDKKITGEEIQKQFQDYSGSVLTFADGSQVVAFPRGNQLQRDLHEAMKVRISQVITIRRATQGTNGDSCHWSRTGQT